MTTIFSEHLVPIEDQNSQHIFLLLDEVPCNSDPGFDNMFSGRPSGDWKSLKTNGVNLMMVLKPVDNSGFKGVYSYLIDKTISRKTVIDLCLPDDIAHLQLSRIYRCTKNIAEFYEEMVTHLNKPDIGVNYGMNSSSMFYSSGHEIHGDRPEVLLLPKCNCFGYCRNPMEHLLQANKTKILSMLKRIQSKFTVLEITVVIDTLKDEQKCVNWIKTELTKENDTICNIVIKTIGQCRGLEFPVLLVISFGNYYGSFSSTLDAWTRVTTSLFIIQRDNDYSSVSRGLKACLKKQVAKEAEEQEEIKQNLLRKLYFFLQSPLFIRIFTSSLICVFIFLMVNLSFFAFISNIGKNRTKVEIENLVVLIHPDFPSFLLTGFLFLLLSSFLLYMQSLHLQDS